MAVVLNVPRNSILNCLKLDPKKIKGTSSISHMIKKIRHSITNIGITEKLHSRQEDFLI